MNKVLLAVATVLGLGAGGYYLLPQDQINQYAKFLPEPVASFLTTEVVGSDEIAENDAVDDVIADAPPVQDLSQLQATENNPIVEENAFVAENPVQQEVDSVSNVVEEIATQEIVEQEVVETAPTPVDSASKAEVASKNMTPEVSKLQKELDAVQKSISSLDSENVVLEERFQKILRKNRDLALELKKINEQIESTN